ncbi:MAG: oligosaccharide flippase family protein [Bacteroidota bacterium]
MVKFLSKVGNNDNFLSLLGHIIFATLGFISFVAVARTLDKNDFGQWVLYITTASFIEMLRFGITRTAVIRFLSGSDPNERKALIGSNYFLGLVITLAICILIIPIYFIFSKSISNSGFIYFFEWYPILAFINLPFNNALTILQADQKFKEILYIRSFNIGAFVLLIVLNLLFFHLGIDGIIILHLIINILTSLICMFLGWDGFLHFSKFNSATNKKIFDFGKFSAGTVIGSNLLKSADTFIIGISAFMGTAGVATYSIPLKLTELLEIPLRSFAATLLPKLSKASIDNNLELIKNEFYKYTGNLTLAFIAICTFGFIFSEELVILLAGKDYIESSIIFKVFCIYGLLLPIDRFSGVTLDSLNRPHHNFLKVGGMALINIIGNLIAVFYFKSLIYVSLVTIFMTLMGVVIGLYYLNKDIHIEFSRFFKFDFKTH